MHYQCRLRRNADLRAADGAEAGLVDYSVAADHSVVALRNVYASRLLGGVKYHDDVLPGVALGVAFQAEGHETVLHGQKLEVLAHAFGIAEAERRVVLAHGNEVAVIAEHLRIFLQVGPVQAVNAVRGIKTVVHTLLVS